MTELLTVGHGTLSQDDFTDLLHEAEVQALVDVRIAPGSRRSPHFLRDEMSTWLPAAGVDYRWERDLGGFRRSPLVSPDVALRNASFRAYAAYMRTDAFQQALAGLLVRARGARTAVMCSETVWWRCHRRLIADHASLVEGVTVMHLMPRGRLAPHAVTHGVRVADRSLVYDLVDLPTHAR